MDRGTTGAIVGCATSGAQRWCAAGWRSEIWRPWHHLHVPWVYRCELLKVVTGYPLWWTEGAIYGANLGYEFIPYWMRSEKRSYQEFPNHILAGTCVFFCFFFSIYWEELSQVTKSNLFHSLWKIRVNGSARGWNKRKRTGPASFVYPRVNLHIYGTSPCLMGKSTINGTFL